MRPLGLQRFVVAVGGNALLRRGEPLTVANQRRAVRELLAPVIAELATKHEVVLTHGNGPQVGQLALGSPGEGFDVLGAETQGEIGHLIAEALPAAAVMTQVLVDPDDPAFAAPTKFVGPVYTRDEAETLACERGWTVKADGRDGQHRRVVPSPQPQEIVQLGAVRALLAAAGPPPLSFVPVACGGGGVPVVRRRDSVDVSTATHGSSGAEGGGGHWVPLEGVEAVIDKDHSAALLAAGLGADGLVILTDGGGVWDRFGENSAREMLEVTPEYLMSTGAGRDFPGSMLPKIEAAAGFVERSPKPEAWAVIGDLSDAARVVASVIKRGRGGNHECSGTLIRRGVVGEVVWW